MEQLIIIAVVIIFLIAVYIARFSTTCITCKHYGRIDIGGMIFTACSLFGTRRDFKCKYWESCKGETK